MPSPHMITFERDPWHFAFRTVAVAIHKGHVLLHRAETDNSWALPGGRVELGESAVS